MSSLLYKPTSPVSAASSTSPIIAKAPSALCLAAVVRDLGIIDYVEAWQAMQHFTATRDAETSDEIWLAQHPPVYTIGRNGRLENSAGYPTTNTIAVVHSDRGGQVTYHGPGQLIAYVLMDLGRRHWGAKILVNALEQAAINLLQDVGIEAVRQLQAPGVYTAGKKIAAIGLRIRNGCSYHGIALNVAMDLRPFRQIYPCGQAGLEVTQLSDFAPITMERCQAQFTNLLLRQLGYNAPSNT